MSHAPGWLAVLAAALGACTATRIDSAARATPTAVVQRVLVRETVARNPGQTGAAFHTALSSELAACGTASRIVTRNIRNPKLSLTPGDEWEAADGQGDLRLFRPDAVLDIIERRTQGPQTDFLLQMTELASRRVVWTAAIGLTVDQFSMLAGVDGSRQLAHDIVARLKQDAMLAGCPRGGAPPQLPAS